MTRLGLIAWFLISHGIATIVQRIGEACNAQGWTILVACLVVGMGLGCTKFLDRVIRL